MYLKIPQKIKHRSKGFNNKNPEGQYLNKPILYKDMTNKREA
jgi:hypothetical protein